MDSLKLSNLQCTTSLLSLSKIQIVRDVRVATFPFMDYFKGFDKVDAVAAIFGDKTKEVLQNLMIEFSGRRGYMGVSNKDGHLIISADYLNQGDLIDIYLDIIHELVHVKQFLEGKELFDRNYNYVDRPTEIEAFFHAVKEARRLGLSDERICQYLKTEWMSDEEFHKLTQVLKVTCESSSQTF